MKARKAENESDLNSDCDKNLRKVRQKKNMSSDGSSESSDELNATSLGIRCPKKNIKITRLPTLPVLSVNDSSTEVQSQQNHQSDKMPSKPEFESHKFVGLYLI